MRLRIDPFWFLVRLVALFLLTYVLWKPIAPYYTDVLFHASRAGVWLSEFSLDPTWSHGTTLLRSPAHPTGIFYKHRNFDAFPTPIPPQGIPAEWVMANLVLLIPLMLATPAPSWAARFGRLALALAIALVVQVGDMVITIKAFYASVFSGQWSAFAQELYGLLDAFVQGFDAQLFPFAIWAGIHFRELVGSRLRGAASSSVAAPSGSRAPARPARAERRRRGRGPT
jgi:hypothetical protein